MSVVYQCCVRAYTYRFQRSAKARTSCKQELRTLRAIMTTYVAACGFCIYRACVFARLSCVGGLARARYSLRTHTVCAPPVDSCALSESMDSGLEASATDATATQDADESRTSEVISIQDSQTSSNSLTPSQLRSQPVSSELLLKMQYAYVHRQATVDRHACTAWSQEMRQKALSVTYSTALYIAS